MAHHKFNFRLITRDDSTAASCDAWRGQEADRAHDQDGGGRSFVVGRTPKPVTGIEISGPDDQWWCRKSFLNLQDILETQLEGWIWRDAVCPRRGISGDGRPR